MMKRKYNKLIKQNIVAAIIMLLFSAMLFGTLQVSAVSSAPYSGYYYNKWGEACPAPNGYNPESCVDAVDLGVGSFGTVNDLASDTSGRLYLMDSDKSLVYQMDKDMKLLKTISVKKNGEALSFSGANGFTVWEKGKTLQIYIADTMNKRILVSDDNGNLIREIKKPVTDLLEKDQVFSPIKVIVAEDGSVFALCQQMYDGAILMDSSGEFLGFFGSNKVEVSANLLSDQFWKNLLGEKLRGKFARYVPREYTNFAIDEKGFVYTTTLVTSGSSVQIRRLNWNSENILNSESFGDSNNRWGTNKFIDIACMGDGVFAALDTNKGRVFIYSNDGYGVSVFGGSGTQDGTFRTSVAIEAINDCVYVYDQSTQRITKFAPTEYGTTLLKASRMFLKGNYDTAQPLWEEILRQNNGYERAYISIGRNLMEQKRYEEALECFKQGGSKSDYSDAFEQIRSMHMRKWFGLYALIFVAVVVVIFYLLRDKGSYKTDDRPDPVTLSQKIRYTLFHPVNGTKGLVCGNMKMNIAMPVIILIAFFISILNYQFTGFIFNENQPGKMDIVTMFIAISGIFFVVVLSNWLVTTMADGKGKFIEIANVIAFSLIPALFAQLINIILSNVLVSSESMFLEVISMLGIGWSIALAVAGLGKIHQFSFGRNLFMIFLTLLAAVIVLILLLLCFSIAKQLELFITSIFSELKMIL